MVEQTAQRSGHDIASGYVDVRSVSICYDPIQEPGVLKVIYMMKRAINIQGGRAPADVMVWKSGAGPLRTT